MNVGELFVKVGIEAGDFNSTLDKIDSRLKQIANLSGLNINLGGTKGFSDITSGAEKMREALASALPVADQLKARLQEQQTKYGVLSAALAQTQEKYGATSTAAQKQELALQKLDNSINQTKAALNALGNESKETSTDMQSVTGAAGGMGSALQNALSFAGGQLLANGIQAVTGAIAGGIQTATDFEHALSGVSAVAGGLSSGELENLRAKALQIGADTSLSASQAVSAFEALVANGIDPTSAGFNGIADSTVALAEATGSDLTTAANVATDVIQNFAGAGNDLKGVVNGITGVTIAGKFGIEDYNLALSNGGVAVAGYGVSLSDFNTGLAAVSSAFKSGQTAGTAFRTFVERLTPSSNTAKEAMLQLGLITEDGTNKFYNLDGSLKSMADIFGVVQESFGGLSEESKAAFAEQIFGADAINFVTAAARQGADGFNQYAASIAEVNASDIAAERLNNLAGSTEQLKGAMETLSITVFGAITPALMSIVQTATGVVNGVTQIVQAIMGSQTAFDQLPSSIQYVVSAIQMLGSYFSQLADAASGWGNAIGVNFANGIISAAQSVIDALMQMGDIISYWLTPGSPPPLLPNLDIWGRDAAQVYLDSFSEADYSTLQTMGNTVKDVLTDLFDSGSFAQSDIIPTVLGTRNAFTEVQEQLNRTGVIGESAIQKVLAATGAARSTVEPMIRAYFESERATLALSKAQDVLAESQKEVDRVTEAYNKKLDPLRKQLEAITDQEDKIGREERIKELRDQLDDTGKSAKDALSPVQAQLRAVNRQQKMFELDKDIAKYKEQLKDTNPEMRQIAAMKLAEAELEKQQLQLENQADLEDQKAEKEKESADRKKAQLELERLLLEEKIKQVEKEQKGAVDVAQVKVDAAKKQLEDAQKQVDLANKQYELEQKRIQALKEQNDLLEKQAKGTGVKSSGAGGGATAMSKAQKDAEAAKKAQDQYNYSIADTDGKLAILKNRLAGVQEGSAEYYSILGQINGLEKQKANEAATAAQKAATDAEARRKAELNYNMQISDTQGKLALLRGELANVEEGSAEYYSILGQIAGLEKTAAQEAEKAAKGIGKVGGAGGVAAGQIKPLQTTLQETTSTVRDVNADFLAMKDAQLEASDASMQAATPASRFNDLMQFLQPLLFPVQTGLTAIGNAITSFFAPAMAVAGPMLQKTGVLLGEMGAAFMTVLGQIIPPILDGFKKALEALQPVFQVLSLGFAGFVAGFIGVFNGLVSAVTAMMPGLGQIVVGVIKVITDGFAFLGTLFGQVVDLVANLIAGNWSGAWQIAQDIVTGVIEYIITQWSNFLTIIIGVANTLVSGVVGLFEGMYESVTGKTSNLAKDVSDWFEGLQKGVVQFVTDLVLSVIQWFTDLYDELVGHSIIPDMVNAILKWIADMKTKVITFVIELVNKFISLVSGLYTSVVLSFGNLVTNVVGKARTLYTDVTTKVNELKNKATEYFNTLKENISTAFNNAVTSVSFIMGEMYATAVDKARELKDDVAAKVEELPSKLYDLTSKFVNVGLDLGKSIIDGMIDGIKNNLESLINEIKRIAKKAYDDAIKAITGKGGSSGGSSSGNSGQKATATAAQGMAGDAVNGMASLMSNTPVVLPPIGGSGIESMPTGDIITINMDLRGSNLTEDRVKVIVMESFKELSRTTTRVRGV